MNGQIFFSFWEGGLRGAQFIAPLQILNSAGLRCNEFFKGLCLIMIGERGGDFIQIPFHDAIQLIKSQIDPVIR